MKNLAKVTKKTHNKISVENGNATVIYNGCSLSKKIDKPNGIYEFMADELIKINELDSQGVEIQNGKTVSYSPNIEIKKILDCIPFISDDIARHKMQGIFFDENNMVVTNGYVLICLQSDWNLTTSFVLKKDVIELIKMVWDKKQKYLELHLCKKESGRYYFIVELLGYKIQSFEIDEKSLADFPQYKKVIPPKESFEKAYKIQVNKDLIEKIKSLHEVDKYVYFDFTNNKIFAFNEKLSFKKEFDVEFIKTTFEEKQEFILLMPCRDEFNLLSIEAVLLNNNYIKEIFTVYKNKGNEEITIGFGGATKALIIN